jgi:hypothetical protein
MTTEEALKIIKDGRIVAITIRGNNEDETKFNQENIEALNVIVTTMHKYQKIEDIYYHQRGEALENSLREVIENDR